MKSTIIAIVGPSGCGKTTLVEHLKKELHIPVIVSYTTRPIRETEIDGIDHHFVSDNEMPQRDEMLAYTQFGGYHYWAHINQVPHDGVCSYVVDEKGLMALQDVFGRQYRIIPILIQRNEQLLRSTIEAERLQRDLSRTPIQESSYQAVIENNGSLKEFLDKALTIIKTFI